MRSENFSACLAAVAALDAAIAGKVKPVPDGWFTVDEFAAHIGRSYRRASERLTNGIKDGFIEREPWNFAGGSGFIYRATPSVTANNTKPKT